MKGLLAGAEIRLASRLIRQIAVRDQYKIDGPFCRNGVDLRLYPRGIGEIANYCTHFRSGASDPQISSDPIQFLLITAYQRQVYVRGGNPCPRTMLGN
ncbi:hypothetical protein LMG3431_04694 [Achromobacter pestifer]|uniref:Uncharacterized protein n=1 Tax=Achromobacter pestifer TaxID=1353889 RepID=A0A6S6ZMZ4_9BURK|nr:hypothetical protein LMG3431_04694 [Achromobacter pestifer]